MHTSTKWNENEDQKLNLLWQIPILDDKDATQIVFFRQITHYKGLYLWLRDNGFTAFSKSFLKNFFE
jgi:hypothetical protein